MNTERSIGRMLIIITAGLLLTACGGSPASASSPSSAAVPSSDAKVAGQIYLYGEQHGSQAIMEKETELWQDHYDEGMRHLFVEYPSYTAGFLNLWMQSDGDELLDEIYSDWEGTAAHNPYIKDFFRSIKRECPETVFHGTDVGHQYDTTGARFLEHLESIGGKDGEQYRLTQETIEQGKHYYDTGDDLYRENKMAENFVREYDKLNGESIMGIYGSAHTGLGAMDSTGAVECMATQLQNIYGDSVSSENLTAYAIENIEPLRTDRITVGGKEYKASYFGEQDLSGIPNLNLARREFWRLEDAYDDLKGLPRINDMLPYNNYPMAVEQGQVFVIDYTATNGAVERTYYRSDGDELSGAPATVAFAVR